MPHKEVRTTHCAQKVLVVAPITGCATIRVKIDETLNSDEIVVTVQGKERRLTARRIAGRILVVERLLPNGQAKTGLNYRNLSYEAATEDRTLQNTLREGTTITITVAPGQLVGYHAY